jgi:hypothetical protein
MVPPGTANYYFTIDGERAFMDGVRDEKQTHELLHGGVKLLKLKVPKTNIIENII